MRRSCLVSLIALALGGAARAEDQARPPAPGPVASDKKPVRVGPTTVTVIDEHESIDDIITRVRKGRPQRSVAPPTSQVQPPVPAVTEERKGKGRGANEGDRTARKQARERLREVARDRRVNRLRGARAE